MHPEHTPAAPQRFSESASLSPKAVTPHTLHADFSRMVAALAKPGATIGAHLDAHPDKAHLLHMAVGVSGEVAELLAAIESWCDTRICDDENVREECGDILFYVEGMRPHLGYEVETLLAAMPTTLLAETSFGALRIGLKLAIAAGDLLDLVKKHAVYGKPIDADAVRLAVFKIEHCVVSILSTIETTREEALQANMAKLSKRYSSGSYSDQQAQARADKGASES